MPKHTLVSIALALSTLTSATLPTVAQSVSGVQQVASSSQSVIPVSTALTVTFPNNMVVDAKKNQDYPMTLFLAQPLFDSQGNQIVAANSPIAAKMKPTKGGAQIIAESLVINGQVVAIQASSPLIPSYSVSKASGYQSAREGSSVLANISGGITGGATGNSSAFNRASMFGGGIGALVGLASAKTYKVVEIPAGSVYVLTLEAPVIVGSSQTAPQAEAPPAFQFRTVQDYSTGLTQLLQAHQRGDISAAQVLDRVRAADAYATTQLQTPLYPPASQRQFIKQLVGFEYAVDQG
ncbi:MAG: hypothetical protein ACFCU8_02425 [Thermosynechococcaceae cyanobacterium]